MKHAENIVPSSDLRKGTLLYFLLESEGMRKSLLTSMKMKTVTDIAHWFLIIWIALCFWCNKPKNFKIIALFFIIQGSKWKFLWRNRTISFGLRTRKIVETTTNSWSENMNDFTEQCVFSWSEDMKCCRCYCFSFKNVRFVHEYRHSFSRYTKLLVDLEI